MIMKHNNIFNLILTGILFSMLLACSSTKKINIGDPLTNLQTLMTGSFDSSDQAVSDSSFFDISLHMYPIWPNDKESKWLYVEQAVSMQQDKPYRQRVYELIKGENGALISKVYTIQNQKDFIGAWKTPNSFGGLDNKNKVIQLKAGCEVYLMPQDDGSYKGSTKEGTCPSTLRGASYATSEVEIKRGQLTSWDQGFDKDGNQVWGAVSGPYIFKLKPEK